MKCQILFSGKNKKNIINLSSAENAQRVVKVKTKIRPILTYGAEIWFPHENPDIEKVHNDISTSTNQICRTEEKANRTTTFHK